MFHRRQPIEPGLDDGVLQQLLHSSQPDGLELLAFTHGGRVRGWLRQRFGDLLDEASIEEAMGHALRRVWRARHAYNPSLGTARAWLAAIARRCALAELARQRKLAQLFLRLDANARDPRSQPDASHDRLLHDLYLCIDTLPPLQRTVILADLDAHGPVPTAELARRCDSSYGAIYAARSKAILSLRRQLADLGYGFAARAMRSGRTTPHSERSPATPRSPNRAEQPPQP